MKTFVVSYLDFFDNIIKMDKVEGISKEDALRKYFFSTICPDNVEVAEDMKGMTYEDIQSYAADADIAVEIMEI